MRVLTLWLALLVLLGSRSAAEEVQSTRGWHFFGETVQIHVDDGWFTVEAAYVFLPGRDSESLELLLPFPADSTLGQPRLLNAWITKDGAAHPLKVMAGADGWRFILDNSGSPCQTVHISYGQSMRGERAVYVLSSVQEWGQPLTRALLEVRVPEGRECKISPNLPAAGCSGGKEVFRGTFEDWYPEEDLVIEFRPSG